MGGDLTLRRVLQSRSLPLLVYDEFLLRITTGDWKPGTMIPSEATLAAEMQVSIGTIRKALAILRENHLIERRQGRGTIVVDQSAEDVPVRFSNFFDAAGRRTSGEVEERSVETGGCSSQELAALKCPSADKCMLVHQVRSLHNIRFLSEDWLFNDDLFPGLTETPDFPHRVAVIAQRYGVVLEKSIEEISIQPLSERGARDLLAEPGAPTCHFLRHTYTIDGKLASIRRGFFILPPNCSYRTEMR